MDYECIHNDSGGLKPSLSLDHLDQSAKDFRAKAQDFKAIAKDLRAKAEDIRAKAQDFRAKDPSVHSIIVRRRTHIYIYIYIYKYIYIHAFLWRRLEALT